MSEIFPETPITSLPAAVAFLGALPMKVGPEPQALSVEREQEIRSLDLLALMDDHVAPVISGHLTALLAEVTRLRAERAAIGDEVARFGIYGAALPATKALVKRADELVTENAGLRARVAELEHTVQQMVEGLNGYDCPPPNEAPLETVTRWMGYLGTAEARVAELEALELGDLDGRVSATCAEPSHPTWLRSTTDTRGCPWCRVAELEAERHTANEALSVEDECSCPPADRVEPHQVGCALADVPCPVDGPLPGLGSGSPEMRGLRTALAGSVDAVTRVFSSVASLREASSREEPHDSPLHQAHRLGHDLDVPGTGGAL